MIRIRASRPEDAEELFDIWDAAVRATHDFLSPQDFAFFSALVRDAYLPAGGFWCAVDENDRPLGFLGMSGGKIDALFVAPDQHRRGIGTALLRHALSLSSRPTLDVNEQNAGAVAFYERHGFRRVGRSTVDDSGRPYPLIHMAL